MSWEAVGALAEFFGAVGVIATLVFLARQVQQNTRASRASTNRAISNQRNEINFRFGLDPAAVDLLMRGGQDRGDLEPRERLRHTLLLRAIIGFYEDTYVQFSEGMCDRETWELSKSALRPILAAPGVAAWWEENRELVRSGFRSEIDELIRGTPPNKELQLT